MKHFLILNLILLLLVGCKKFEEFKENDATNLESEENMIMAITGAYDRFQQIFKNYPSNDEANVDHGFDWYQQNSKGDDFNHSALNVGYYELIDSQIVYHCTDDYSLRLYSYRQIYEPWYDYYKTIVTLNTIIDNVEKLRNVDTAVKKILGEAYLLRGYIYFRLMRVYGEIPLVNDTQVNYTISRSTFEEIYDFIEKDLETAIDLLPANKEEARIPYATPHVGTAKAILAEVYLTRAGFPLKQTEYYARAAETAGNIIDSASYYGFDILPDFSELWNDRSLWNEETVFALYYYSVGSGFHSGGNRLGLIDGVIVLGVIAPRNNHVYGPGIKFFNDYPQSYRKEVTFYSLFTEPYSIESFNDRAFVFVETDTMDLCTPVYYNKFEIIPGFEYATLYYPDDPLGDHYSFRENGSNTIYIYRYAQTLLTFAEARARSGQPDAQAYEAVNIIRRRAHRVDLYSPSEYDLTPGLSAGQFVDSVLWERAWELCAEPEGRWFDLMRLEMVEDLPSLRDVNDMRDYPDVITKDFYFRDIPESEIDLNPNLQ
jgi:hypothetical protein